MVEILEIEDVPNNQQQQVVTHSTHPTIAADAANEDEEQQIVVHTAQPAAIVFTEETLNPERTHHYLTIGQRQLYQYCHNPMQHQILSMAGYAVYVQFGAVRIGQILSHRLSHINALLMQSRGRLAPQACTACQRRPRPFDHCTILRGYFHGSCANCKWHDQARACSLYDSTQTQGEGPPPDTVDLTMIDMDVDGEPQLQIETGSDGQEVIVLD